MSSDGRLDALERQVAELSAEVRALREARSVDSRPHQPQPDREEVIRERLRHAPPRRLSAEWIASGTAVSGKEIESLVGRYGTLALAALVILMAVGAVIKMAVQRGLLTPEVRILAGVLVVLALAGAGLVFRSRGEVRYGGVLLALSLAVVDLVAWGAGPRFHLVPSAAALAAVDVASLLIAGLALHDGSEFLFCVAIGGALSAPFVASDQQGTALALLAYGGVVLAGATRSARAPGWYRAFALLVAGALLYSLAAAALPASSEWYGPLLISLFCGGCALVALILGESEWRSELSRSFLAVGVIGTVVAIDAVANRPLSLVLSVAIPLALLTQATLVLRAMPARLWRSSALALPFVSLGLAGWAANSVTQAMVVAAWAVIALIAWHAESRQNDSYRSGSHLLSAGLLGSLAVTSWLWGTPLAFVAGLAAWAVIQAFLGMGEAAAVPLIGVAIAGGAAALSAIDQLASRNAYGYVPFATRSSASALVATLGLVIAGELVSRGKGEAAKLVDRPMTIGVTVAFLIVWGRMELAHAYSPDLAAFLLTSYYAACGVGSIIAGRGLAMSRLRIGGLCLAIYAAVKALVEVTNISSLLLRVGAYAAVGVFLLGAGYLYREQREQPSDVMS